MRPTIEDLECLIMWPKGTAGYWEERANIQELLKLCEDHGFGRIPQMAQQIEEIWRGEEKAIKKMKKMKKEHFDSMRHGWKDVFGKKPCLYTEEYM